MIKIIKTPQSFKAKKQLTYPPNQGNDIMIEEYFYNYILSGRKILISKVDFITFQFFGQIISTRKTMVKKLNF